MANRKRNAQLAIRVTEEEREQIARRMEQAGVRSLRAYLLKMAVDGFGVNLDLADVRECSRLLRITSNNEADIQDLREHYDKLWEQANRILKGLAKL